MSGHATPRRTRPLVVGAAIAGIVAVIAAAAFVGGLWPGGSHAGSTASAGPTGTPSATPTASPSVPTTVRWFVGLGSGTQPGQIEAEKAFVTAYNRSQSEIVLRLEVVPNAQAADALRTEIAAGNGPDIVGPIGTRAADQLPGLFMDLNPEIQAQQFDLNGYEPALLQYLQLDGVQIGLPYLVYPGFIFYNKDLFTKAGLPDLPKKVGETYQGETWDWTELGRVAAQLTVDTRGKNATQAGFNPNDTIQYGIGFQWADARRLASTFGGGSFLAPDGRTAQIPSAWRDAYNWYHDAIWKGRYSPPASTARLLFLGGEDPYAPSSGRVAMVASWPWAISSYGTAGRTRFSNWDMAVMPSWKGQTSSPLDMDSFRIARTSQNPDQAFKAMTAIMADPTLAALYGGMPARTADQAAWFDAMDKAQAPVFPGNEVSWSVLQEMAKYPATPSHDTYLPNDTLARSDAEAFLTRLMNMSGLDVSAELDKLKAKLQADFDAALPILQE